MKEEYIALLQSMAEEKVTWRKRYAHVKISGVEKGKRKMIPVFLYFFGGKKDPYCLLYVGLDQFSDRIRSYEDLLAWLQQASNVYKFKRPKEELL